MRFLLKITRKRYESRNDQYFKIVRSQRVIIIYGESTCIKVLPCFQIL